MNRVAADLASGWTLTRLATKAGRSASHLNVLFSRATGLTVREYILFLRMTEAARQLTRGVKVEAVALLVGFRSRTNFYRQFKAWFGATPARWRRHH